MKSSGKRFMFLLTASFKILVSTAYNSARSELNITYSFLIRCILFSIAFETIGCCSFIYFPLEKIDKSILQKKNRKSKKGNVRWKRKTEDGERKAAVS